jgi:hypothetical protein
MLVRIHGGILLRIHKRFFPHVALAARKCRETTARQTGFELTAILTLL